VGSSPQLNGGSGMSVLPMVSEEDAAGKVADVYKEIKREFQIPFVPNFFKVQASSPQVLTTTWTLVHEILVNGNYVPRTIKEMIFVAVSNARKCAYCEAAHLAFCKLLGIDEKKREALADALDTLLPERLQDIVRFAIKVATAPLEVVDEDFAILSEHGVSEAELMEIISMASVATYATIIADTLKVEVDDDFKMILRS
jgi:uncharacterized peroxidase-related enzyme